MSNKQLSLFNIKMELHVMFNTLIRDIHPFIEQELFAQIYESFNKTIQSDLFYLAKLFCNNQGDFYPFTLDCLCDPGMFGFHCRERGISFWRGGWAAMQVIFGIAFGILSIVMWFGFITKIKENRSLKGKLIQLFTTPKYLVLINLVWITTARFFFIIIDPFCQRKILPHSLDLIVYDMIYSSYVAFYLLQLIVWNGLQTVFDMGMKKISKRCYAFLYQDVKIILVIALILTYPGQIIISHFQASRNVQSYIKTAILFVFFFFFLFLFLSTIGLICQLKQKLYGIYEDKKLSDDLVIKYMNSQGQNQTDERDKNNAISFLREIIQMNLLDTVESYVFDRNVNSNNDEEQSLDKDKDVRRYDINDESEYGLDFEKEIIKFDCYQDNTNEPASENSSERTNSKRLDVNNKIDRKESKSSTDKKKKFELTKNDLEAMNKIFGMSYAFIAMTLIILSISCSISFQSSYHSPTSTFITICVEFICEIVAIGIIYSLFFRNMKLQEYQNLKIIGEIDKYLNQNQESKPKIVFKDFTKKEAFMRFKSYVKELKE